MYTQLQNILLSSIEIFELIQATINSSRWGPLKGGACAKLN
jgi:hypothetical protein